MNAINYLLDTDSCMGGWRTFYIKSFHIRMLTFEEFIFYELEFLHEIFMKDSDKSLSKAN